MSFSKTFEKLIEYLLGDNLFLMWINLFKKLVLLQLFESVSGKVPLLTLLLKISVNFS